MNLLKTTFFVIVLISHSSVFADRISSLRKKFLDISEKYQRLDPLRLDVLSDGSFRKALDTMGVSYDELSEETLVYLRNHWDDPTIDFSPGNKIRDSFSIHNVPMPGVSDPGKERMYREYEVCRKFFVLRLDLDNQDQLGNIVTYFHGTLTNQSGHEASHFEFDNFMNLIRDELKKGYAEITEEDFVAAVFSFAKMNNYPEIVSRMKAWGWVNLSLLRSPHVDLPIKEALIQTMYRHVGKHHLSDKDVLLKWWEEVKYREDEHRLEEFIASSLDNFRLGYDRNHMADLMKNDEFISAVIDATKENEEFSKAVNRAYKNIQSSMETSS